METSEGTGQYNSVRWKHLTARKHLTTLKRICLIKLNHHNIQIKIKKQYLEM